MQIEMDLFGDRFQSPLTGPQLAQAGIKTALNHAEENNPGWEEKVFELLKEFSGLRQDFICEDFRDYCEQKGLPSPTINQAFGGIMRKAAKEKVIRHNGQYRPTKKPESHGRPAAVWERI